MSKTIAHIFVAAIFSWSFMGGTTANAADRASQGLVRCGGNNFLRASNTEVHQTNYTLRNFDPAQPIVINGLRVFNATGAIIYDSAVSGLPPALNGLIGPANNTLNPHQSTVILTSSNFLPFLAPTDRPIQLLLAWSSASPAVPLDVRAIFIVRERDPATGDEGAERARNGGKCESILVP
jgi:hypothetical protein